jgi:PAS domain S-box-containing protein
MKDKTIKQMAEALAAKQTLALLKDSETRYRRLFETAQDGILILDALTGRITDVNPFLEDMLGYSHEEFMGKRIWEIGPVIDIPESRRAFMELQKRKFIRYENLPLETKNGKSIQVEFVSNVYAVDHTKVIQCNIRDITDRKHLELQAQSIIQTAMDGFWIADIQGRFLNVNDAYCKMTGYRRRELLKMNIHDVEAGGQPEETAVHIQKLLEAAVPLNPASAAPAAGDRQKRVPGAVKYRQRYSAKGGAPDFKISHERFETKHRCKNGAIIDIEFSANYTDIDGGRFFVFLRDITQQKQAVEAINKSETKLRTIFEAVPCTILIMDDQLTVRSANGAAKHTFGIPETSIINHRWGDMLRCTHAEETTEGCGSLDVCSNCQVRTTVLAALAGAETQRVRANFEFFIDGHIHKRLFSLSAAPIEYERKRMAVLTVEDITELSYLRQRLRIEHSFAGIVGKDEKMMELYATIRELAESSAQVLIQGESGTGKELVASALHNEGPRRHKRFVPVNCGSLPDGLLESELFGHCKGSFTGAIRDKKGRFELADGGTIFLDEVGDLSPAMQVKLLRVLQDGTFEPVGSEKTMKVDVRVISATNKDLREEIKAGRFREDLFYRLCVVPITMPPLRDRLNDIPLLAESYLEWSAKESNKKKISLSHEVLDILMGYNWPGNVRELQNALQFALIKCQGRVIEPQYLPGNISPAAKHLPVRRKRKCKLDSKTVEDALQKTKGNKLKAAKLLGVSRATIHRFLAEK